MKYPKCPWCDKPILLDELTAMVDNEEMHLQCAIEEEEDVFFDRDMEFGDK